jgi:hypothetical protein
MFFRKKNQLPDLSLAEINNRLRAFIMDSQIQNGHELSVVLGCSILSDELQEHEEYESDKRLEKISYLIPLMYAFSHTLAEGATEYQRANTSEELKELPDDIWWESRKVMEQLSLSVLMGAVSQLIDMNLLEVPKHSRRKK